MSGPTLRPTTAGDLPALSRLTEAVFGRRRSPELLRWLLLSDRPGLDLQSRVVEQDGEVVGHVAVLCSRYGCRDRVVVGSHPVLWMVAPEARGRAGIVLGRWCLSHQDFTTVVGGTPTSRTILDKRHFVRAALAIEIRLPTRAAGAAAGSGCELVAYDGVNGAQAPDGVMVGLADPSHLHWLADCPQLASRLLTLRIAGTTTGPVLLYVNRRVDPPSGRIVHLPWCGGRWDQALRLALEELAGAGCASASLLVTCPELLAAARELGGEPFYERPVFFRKQREMPEPAGWHLSYLEGDLAYRRV